MSNTIRLRSQSANSVPMYYEQHSGKTLYKVRKKPIGEGSFSIVHVAINNKGERFAIKKIKPTKIHKSRIEKFELELKISLELDHKNIVKCYEIFKDDENKYNIVNEYCNYGTFDDVIMELKKHEPKNKEISGHYYLSQLKDAIYYLHKKNILHRDLKPANVLISRPKDTDPQTVKLADFGFARYFENNSNNLTGYDDMISTCCGTPIYMAPELILEDKYNTKADLWSFGVIMYEMLYSMNPFNSNSLNHLAHLMKTKTIDFPNIYSEECIDLLTKLLKVDPVERIGWEEFFDHEWFSMTLIDENENDIENTSGKLSENGIFEFEEDQKIEILENETKTELEHQDVIISTDIGSKTVIISKNKLIPTEKKDYVIEREQQLKKTFQLLKDKGRAASDAARELEKSPFSSTNESQETRKQKKLGYMISDLIEHSIDKYLSPPINDEFVVLDNEPVENLENKKKKDNEIKNYKVSVGESVIRILSDSAGYLFSYPRSYGSF